MSAKFEAAEKLLKGKYLVKFDGVNEITDETPESFIKNSFFKYNKQHDSVFAARTVNPKKSLAKVVGKQQTEQGHRRSLGDIFRVTRYYFPNVTVMQIFKILYNLVINEKYIRTSYCHATDKRMFRIKATSYENDVLFDEEIADEFDMTWPEWVDEMNNI